MLPCLFVRPRAITKGLPWEGREQTSDPRPQRRPTGRHAHAFQGHNPSLYSAGATHGTTVRLVWPHAGTRGTGQEWHQGNPGQPLPVEACMTPLDRSGRSKGQDRKAPMIIQADRYQRLPLGDKGCSKFQALRQHCTDRARLLASSAGVGTSCRGEVCVPGASQTSSMYGPECRWRGGDRGASCPLHVSHGMKDQGG